MASETTASTPMDSGGGGGGGVAGSPSAENMSDPSVPATRTHQPHPQSEHTADAYALLALREASLAPLPQFQPPAPPRYGHLFKIDVLTLHYLFKKKAFRYKDTL